MRAILYATLIALICSLAGTPLAVRYFTRRGYGQEIRQDGPKSHLVKRGTPTMGGAVIILSTLIAYFGTKAVTVKTPTSSALLVLFLMAGLGAVGFLDDFIKIYRQRSLGLRAKAKLVGQSAVTLVFALLAQHFPNTIGLTPASEHVSFLRDIGWLSLGPLLFVVWVDVMISGWSNAVNLTDGLDGLAAGTSVMAFAAYVVIGVWQYGQSCGSSPTKGCYQVRDPLDLAIVAAAVMGACFGFLWWNAAPAKIIMGDTGSLALGGAFAGLAICTRTELLALLIGGLFLSNCSRWSSRSLPSSCGAASACSR
ncbi:MAG TPA: phospho-N-acetylmuramoyl-pentapeptide-transferase [Actinocrinis sp.]|jgi:phospho-N-acetylmuramoyl-pentapeptide-transferase|nr:phospho-N-acetylmuramoyl-pentapeptide-transferase [Actinocrinis sp.]HEV3172322.1 phospho-N-acetylmuramoyl-pentapeptide-transferase [Actinocrinis sp.]